MAADLNTLSAEFHKPLFRYLCRIVGDADTARDLTQDVFVRLSRTAVAEPRAGGIRAWVFSIARNLAIDHRRYRQRTPAMEALHGNHPLAASQDVVTAINEALAKLTEIDRDVFLLREVGGLVTRRSQKSVS